MGQLQLHPAEQAIAFTGHRLASQVAVIAEHRHQVAGGVTATALQQVHQVAGGGLVDHARAGMGQAVAIRRQERHGADVFLLQDLGSNAIEQGRVLAHHGRGHQGRQLFGDHFTALQQLGMQLHLLQPGEVPAQYQRHQAGRYQGKHHHTAFDTQFIQHATLLRRAVVPPAACNRSRQRAIPGNYRDWGANAPACIDFCRV
ncbi:hypothetical protein D3C85_808730 [compost metagenome]